VFTDLHEDYHRASDDPEKINLDGLKRVVDFTTGVVAALADHPGRLTYVDIPAPAVAHTGNGSSIGRGYGAYLGSVPDMAGTPGGGVRLSGVRAGSPADEAGLRVGDVITAIGDFQIPDLQAMTEALRAHEAGDVVEIRIRRDGLEQTVTVTLGSRGG
jgi:S1-C subfamily serine protease